MARNRQRAMDARSKHLTWLYLFGASMNKPSDRARRLIEELHEVLGNEKAWEIAQKHLDDSYQEGYECAKTIFKGNGEE